MFLTCPHYEILGETGTSIPYCGRLLYEMAHFCDRDSGLLKKVSAQVAFMAITPIAVIETAVRAPFTLLASLFSQSFNDFQDLIYASSPTFIAFMQPFSTSLSLKLLLTSSNGTSNQDGFKRIYFFLMHAK